MRDDGSGYVQQNVRRIQRDDARYDRLAFARRVLDVLRPPGLNVLLREGVWSLRVDEGRLYHLPYGARWAEVAIPPEASRAEIVAALAELAGVRHDPVVMEELAAQVLAR